MCIRREAGFCCVKYGLCTDADSFSLESVKDMVAMQVGNDDELCLTDYLRIEGSSSTCGLGDATNRYDFQFFIRIPDSSILPLFSYCGHKLADTKESKANVDICDCTAPFSVGVVTDNMPEAASAMVANRGFCLNYVQIPCGTATP